MLGQITGSVGDLDGMEELLVTPGVHRGYDVYATVNLGYDPTLPASGWTRRVEEEAVSFFRSVYNSGEDVEDAEIYFLWNGQTVAGAGLGADSYEKVATAAGGDGGTDESDGVSAGGGSSGADQADGRFVSALESLGDHPQAGADDAWYEVGGPAG